jgi:hypothetical protein
VANEEEMAAVAGRRRWRARAHQPEQEGEAGEGTAGEEQLRRGKVRETPRKRDEREAKGGILILRQAMGGLLEQVQGRLLPHFGDGGKDGETAGGNLKAKDQGNEVMKERCRNG